MAKRLNKTNKGSYILPSGQYITISEQKALRSAVSVANRKRNYRIFNVDSKFVKSKKSARLTHFRNKKEFNIYLRNVQKIARAKINKTNKGSYILPSGQYITISEQKALRSAVNSANRKRKRMLERLPAEAKAKYKDFGIESDFVMRKKTTSLNRFRNKNEFKHYLKSVQKIASGEFERKRIMTYKENYIRALRNTFNSSANKAIKAVRDMDLKTFRQKVESEKLEEIGYVYYDPNGEKLTRISQQLGLA